MAYKGKGVWVGEGRSSWAGALRAVLQVVKLQGGWMRAGFWQVEAQQRGVLWCGELKSGARGVLGCWALGLL
jgi:hypothetical protein